MVTAFGEPICGAAVHLDGQEIDTDAYGKVHFADVASGERMLLLAEPGWVRTEAKVNVRAGVTTRFRLVEDAGGEVLVRVLDEEGEPLPYAELRIPEGAAWADVSGDVQRLDTLTDVGGERRLDHFPSGTWTLRARWGSRGGRGKVTLASGEHETLEIRLPSPR